MVTGRREANIHQVPVMCQTLHQASLQSLVGRYYLCFIAEEAPQDSLRSKAMKGD